MRQWAYVIRRYAPHGAASAAMISIAMMECTIVPSRRCYSGLLGCCCCAAGCKLCWYDERSVDCCANLRSTTLRIAPRSRHLRWPLSACHTTRGAATCSYGSTGRCAKPRCSGCRTRRTALASPSWSLACGSSLHWQASLAGVRRSRWMWSHLKCHCPQGCRTMWQPCVQSCVVCYRCSVCYDPGSWCCKVRSNMLGSALAITAAMLQICANRFGKCRIAVVQVCEETLRTDRALNAGRARSNQAMVGVTTLTGWRGGPAPCLSSQEGFFRLVESAPRHPDRTPKGGACGLVWPAGRWQPNATQSVDG